MKMRLALVATLMTFGMACNGLLAQDDAASDELLTIGSQAPSLDIEHWVQDGDGAFKPVTKFEDGQVYMVEFWATWCGPCIASMPHISELQKEYGDKGLQVVSVSNEDLETVESFLERKVRGEDEMTYAELTSTYCLTTDPDGSVHTDYMRAAKQNGIPTAFIVGKTGLIEWIGHPMRIDQPLSQIINDEWDRDAFAVTFVKKQKLDALMSSLGRLMQQGKSDEVIEKLDAAIAEHGDDEATKMQLTGIRAQILISTNGEGAADAMRDLTGKTEDANALNNLAWSIVEMHDGGEDVSDDLLAAAAEAAEKACKLEPEGGHVVDTLAHLVYIQGDLDRAIELTEKAVEMSGDEFPEIKEFLKKLREEKKGDG